MVRLEKVWVREDCLLIPVFRCNHRGVLYIWVTLTCLFCTTTTILVWSVLRKSNPQPIPTSPESGPNCSINDAIFKNTQQRIRRGVARIAVYCLVPILAQFWNIVIDGVQYSNKDPEANWGLFLLANIFSGLQVCFLQNGLNC